MTGLGEGGQLVSDAYVWMYKIKCSLTNRSISVESQRRANIRRRFYISLSATTLVTAIETFLK